VKRARRRRVRPLFQALRRAARLLGLAVLVAAGGGAAVRLVHAVRAHPYFSVREIDVEARGRVDAQTVVAWAGLAPGMSVWSAGEREAEARLLAHPRIRAATVERQLPGRVKVRVEERTPVAILFADEPLLVALDGAAFPPLAGEATDDLPYVTGFAGKDPTAAPVVARLREAARLAVAWREHGQWPPISEIRPGDDELVVFVSGTPLSVRFGPEARDEDLARLGAVFSLWRGREAQVAAIDLSVTDEAVLTMRGGNKGVASSPALRAAIASPGRARRAAGKTVL
jgi:POTRA domain-containing FtsQ-type protein